MVGSSTILTGSRRLHTFRHKKIIYREWLHIITNSIINSMTALSMRVLFYILDIYCNSNEIIQGLPHRQSYSTNIIAQGRTHPSFTYLFGATLADCTLPLCQLQVGWMRPAAGITRKSCASSISAMLIVSSRGSRVARRCLNIELYRKEQAARIQPTRMLSRPAEHFTNVQKRSGSKMKIC